MIKRILLWGFVVLVVGGVASSYYFLATYSMPPVNPAWAVAGGTNIPDGSVTVRYTGTSTLVFSDGETSWMVDGWFTRVGPIEFISGKIGPDVEAIANGLAEPVNADETLGYVIY